jgi:tetratricopeptide (TPR) repeat protein
MDADETEKFSARVGIMLSQAVAQLDMGQRERALETTRSLMAKFHDYLQVRSCHDLRLAEIQARFGEVKDAMEQLNRCFSQRDEYLKEGKAHSAKYRFYKARDLLSVAVALWKVGSQSNSDRLIGEAIALARSTPYDDEFYYWRRLAMKAVEVGRIDIIEEAVAIGYRDNPFEYYHDIFRFLLNENRKDLIVTLNDSDEARAILMQAHVERGDYLEAVAIGKTLQSEQDYWGKAIRDLARAEAMVNGAEAAITWAGKWKLPSSRFESLLGVADCLILLRREKAVTVN